MLSIVKKYLAFLEKHTLFSVIIVFSLILASLPFVINLKIKPSVQDILPDKHPAVKNIKKLTKIYGGEGFLIVGLGNGQKEELLEFAQKINDLSESYSSIDFVAHRANIGFFKSNFLLYLDLEDLKEIENRILKKIGEANPLYVVFDNKNTSFSPFSIDDVLSKYNLKGYREYFMNEEETYLICLIKPIGSPNNVDFNRKLIADVDGIVDSIKSEHTELSTIDVEYGGLYYEIHVDNIEIINDIFILSLLAFSIITIVLLLHYRRFKTLIIIIFPLIVGIFLNLALTQILVKHLTMLTGFLSGILMGLGLDFGVHVYSRYLLEKQHSPWRDALSHTLVQTGAASMGGALTTASAFYGISIGEFKGFREFGLVAGNGMLLTALSIMLLFPLVIIIYEKQSHRPWFKIKGTLNQFSYKKKAGGFYKKFRYNYNYIRVFFLLVMGFSIYYARQVEYDNDFSRLKGESAALRFFTDKAEAILNYSIKPIVVMSTNREVLRKLEKKYNKSIKNRVTEMMVSCQSINTFIPEHQNEKLIVIKRLKELYKKYGDKVNAEINNPVISLMVRSAFDAEPKKITFDNLPKKLVKEFTSKDGNAFLMVIHAPKYIYRYIPKLQSFHDELNSVEEELRGQFQLAGVNFVLTSITQMVKEDAPNILIMTLICLLVTIGLIFRKIKDVFIVFATLGTGVLIMLGIMGFLNVKFNLFNIVAMPIILGIGVDSTIHICHRLNEFKQEKTYIVMDQVFKVISISSFTTALGFISLIGANYSGLRSIGLLTVIGIASVLIASLIFLPAFLDFLYPDPKDKSKLGS